MIFSARHDLPPPRQGPDPGIVEVLTRQLVVSAVLIGYGPPTAVTPAVLGLAGALERRRIKVLEAIRVTDGRWWSYRCDVVGCCSDEGTPCAPADSVIAAQAVYHGQVALPDRQALVDLVAPVGGEARAAMEAAGARARARLTGLPGGHPVRRAGRMAVREAERRYRSGCPLTDDETAWLGLMLLEPAVREYALGRCSGDDWRVQLWTDVLRRVDEAAVPAAGCLLGLAAWRSGQGALARVAVDRAMAAAPWYRLAALLDNVLKRGISPGAALMKSAAR